MHKITYNSLNFEQIYPKIDTGIYHKYVFKVSARLERADAI